MVLEYIEKAFTTLLHNCGGNTSQEVVCIANEFMEAILFPNTIVTLKENLSNEEEFLAQLRD